MLLVPSRIAIDHLAKSAPRAWVKRMLLGMICERSITPYFAHGRAWAAIHREDFTRIVTRNVDAGYEIENYVETMYGAEIARQFRNPDESYISYESSNSDKNIDYPRPVSIGLFLYADILRLDSGLLTLKIDSSIVNNNDLFMGDEDLFEAPFPATEYDIILEGLSFSFASIELLQPSLELSENFFSPSSASEIPAEVKRGRPRTWDWDGASGFLLSVAQTPDGLPTGPGAQAKIEKMVAEWFVSETSDSPATSQIRSHVARITRSLKKPENL